MASTERFHALDGVRASMMLLGIVFHATWFLIPGYFWHPLTDASANEGILYFFYWVHAFRMQAFFVIAGFFACLLIHKRGVRSFLWNRLKRVAVPFAVFMAILYPIMRYQMIVGGLASGRIQSEAPPLELLRQELAGQIWLLAWPKHLWFLWTLLVIYLFALLLLGLADGVLDRSGRLRGSLQAAMARLLSSPLAFVYLTVPVGLLLFHGGHWFGINAGPMLPLWDGTLIYWIFFAVGWCLFKQPELLGRVGRHWKVHFAAGTLVSLVLCVAFLRIVSVAPGPIYPLMRNGDIGDYGVLRARLLEPQTPVAQAVRDGLSPGYRRFFAAFDDANEEHRFGIGVELTRVAILDPELSALAGVDELPLGPEARDILAIPAGDRTFLEGALLNRRILEAALGRGVKPPWPGPVWQKALYFGGYALASWLCVFGILGFFNRYLRRPSPTFRYFADASYWLYLLHLPVQFAIQLRIAPYPWPWPLKLAVYLVLSFVILVPSYHYLVRSTWVGQFLNGRRFPRTPLLGKRAWPPQPSPGV